MNSEYQTPLHPDPFLYSTLNISYLFYSRFPNKLKHYNQATPKLAFRSNETSKDKLSII